jgi:hypothetical protein
MNLTKAEQQFVSHIRTLHLKRKSSRKDQNIDFVFISLKTIRANYFSKEYEVVFDKLKDLNEIDYEKISKDNGSYYFKFKALKDGPIDFSLLREDSRKLDNLERMVKANLRWVSIEQGVDSTIYFQNFLKQKEKHLDAFFLVDNFSGRIHTPITSLKGSIRKHLLLKNEKVVSLDVAQIQPLLLSFILNENIGINEFTQWIEQGEDIYIKFQEKLNLQNRDEAKTKFYEITFGKANQRLADMFGNSNWIQWVNEVKSISITQNPNSNNKPHSNLAWLLQTTEVTIMRSIWQKLIDNDIIFLTVHDEVIVRESDADEVYQIMIDELKLHFNTFKVNVKTYDNIFPLLVTIDEKIKRIDETKMYYPYELMEKFDLSLEDITALIQKKMLKETFTDCYRIEYKSK